MVRRQTKNHLPACLEVPQKFVWVVSGLRTNLKFCAAQLMFGLVEFRYSYRISLLLARGGGQYSPLTFLLVWSR
jgi:hypothetical protein